MANLRSTHPHFVRCLIPNETKTPGKHTRTPEGEQSPTGTSGVLSSLQGPWTTTWSCTSCAVTACWKVSGSVGRVFPAGSCTEISGRGKTPVQFSHLRVWSSSPHVTDTGSSTPAPSLRVSSSTARRRQRNCCPPSTWTTASTDLDTPRCLFPQTHEHEHHSQRPQTPDGSSQLVTSTEDVVVLPGNIMVLADFLSGTGRQQMKIRRGGSRLV